VLGPDDDAREPGYCIFGCGFHMVTPVPGRSGGVCGNCGQAGRADLPPGPDRPPYAPRLTWWQQWRLQRTAADFWTYGDEEEQDSSFGAFFTSRHWLRRLLMILRRRG
jgi:hypothetical protein